MIVYGIKNCNTVKTALDWLKKKKIDFTFHDYKAEGVTEANLKNWCKLVGWESLVIRKGMTWRQLEDSVKARVTSETAAIALMKEKTSVIKRPLIEIDGEVVVLGFDENEYTKRLSK
jgi:Spx/MgsR family transcriptional regulator